MFESGHSRRIDRAPFTSGLPPQDAAFVKAAVTSALCQHATVRLTRYAGYSITSSARPINVAGKSRPSAFAVFTLMASSNVVA